MVTATKTSLPEVGELGMLREMVGFNLRLAYNQATQLFARAFDDLDLAPIQFAALEFISRNPGTSQKDIARHIGTTPPVLVGPLERLERRDWIVRSRGTTDRRRARVQLTPAGERIMRDVEERVRRVDSELSSRLTARERDRLLTLLRKLSGTP
ncbi:MAG: MarR family transcriptional regulator [Acidobacteriota bacterium]